MRLGGLVETGSVTHGADGRVGFRVTDRRVSIAVSYQGQLPDLFREGQGVIAEGSLGADGVFTAREVLAKHDENYMPKLNKEEPPNTGQMSFHFFHSQALPFWVMGFASWHLFN